MFRNREDRLIAQLRAAQPNPNKIRAWAHALRTTEEPQRTDGSMGAPGCGMCVLGVAAYALATDPFAVVEGDWGTEFTQLFECKGDFPYTQVYALNDDGELTFAEFAEMLDEL